VGNAPFGRDRKGAAQHPFPIPATPVRLKHTKESVLAAVMSQQWRGEHISPVCLGLNAEERKGAKTLEGLWRASACHQSQAD
jgi:hypothetical protein